MELSDIVGWTILTVFVGGISTCCYYDNKSSAEFRANCQLKYHGDTHSEESLYATTHSGCHVMQVDKYNSNCYHIKTLYVTDCKGVNWSEDHGKSGSSDEATVNQ